MSDKRNIPLSVPLFGKKELANVKDCIKTGWISSSGKYVAEFEKKFGEYVGAGEAVACVNGTAALHISLILADVAADDEVIVPTATFIAPVNAIRYVGAYPVFMDCDVFLNIDVEKTAVFIEKECLFANGKLINKKSKRQIKAVIPVHVFGNPTDMNFLMSLANRYGLKVIEDATESLGSYYTKGKFKGKMTGTIGDFGCYSFNGNKIITTGGGGMIVTKDAKTAEKAKYLTTQAKDDETRYIHNEIGYNYRLANIASAIGVAQLEKLNKYVLTKRINFTRYKELLSDVAGLDLIGEPPYGYSNFWFYSLLVDKKMCGFSNIDLMEHLEKKGIQSRPLWLLNHKQKPYRNCLAYRIERAEEFHDKVLNLPCSVNLKYNDIKMVADEIKKYAKK